MKQTRQSAILNIIQSRSIETQEELAEALRAEGYSITQATVSRDIKQLHLVKALNASGTYQYALPGERDAALSDRFVRLFLASVVSVDHAGNIIVVKTVSGSASAAGEAIDNMRLKEVLGTMAGDNTVLVIVHDPDEAASVTEQLRGLLR